MITRLPLVGRGGRPGRALPSWIAARNGTPLKEPAVVERATRVVPAGTEWLGQADSLCRLFDASSELVAILDSRGRILSLNEGGRKALEREKVRCRVGDAWAAFWAVEARTEAAKAVRAAVGGGSARFTARRRNPDGAISWWDIVLSPLPGAGGPPFSVAAISRDVTDQKVAEEQLRWAADHDPATMLPNRALFQRQLESEIGRAAAASGSFGLLLLDLEGFKCANDTPGLAAEDALMCDVVSRLRAGIRRNDFVARLGDDEFAIILGDIAAADDLTAAAEAIFDRLGEPFFQEGRRVECQATIGASIFPQHGSSRLELMKNAGTALYTAKATARGTLRIFEAALRCEMQRLNSMVSLARYALREGRVVPFYQPKVDLRSGALYGFEALLRWSHPTMGTQLPETIQAAFEDDRLSVALSDRMIALVLRDMRRWIDQGIEFGHVAVNAAAAEFRRGDFAERLLGQLRAAAIPPALIHLEVTETVFLGRGSEHVLRALKTMSAAGIQIALDDFGTGYASLSHLKQFPVSTIKIDRSFIRDLHEDAGDEAIVRTLVSLGQSLGVNVVAEGIETPAQSAYLRKHLCAYGQGYLFGAAEGAVDVPALIDRFARRTPALPKAQPRGDRVAPPFDTGPAGAAGRRNVYIVDDNREVRDSTRYTLQTMGYQCRTFASGADFLGVLLQLEPGCILLDVRMDGLSGLQVLVELKWMNLAWPVIVVSGELTNPVVAMAKAEGALALVAKPFDDLQLQRTLAEAFLTLDQQTMGAAELGLSSRG